MGIITDSDIIVDDSKRIYRYVVAELGVGIRELGISSRDAGVGKLEGRVIVPGDHAYQYISLAAPYLEVIEEMTALEFLEFHRKFKPLISNCTIPQILSIVGLEKAANKQIRYYSSGMKQRIKLAQAIFSDTPVILLDEPCTNLDQQGVELYQQLVREYCGKRLVIVSSNDLQEYSFCEEKISILDYKEKARKETNAQS